MGRLKTLKRFGAALAVAAVCHAASAHETGLNQPCTVCMDKSSATTMDMISCITAENHRQDLQLNKAYKVLTAELSPPRRAQLQDAQRAWLKYRDANCAFYGDLDAGTLVRVNANSCMLTVTAKCARELESFRQ